MRIFVRFFKFYFDYILVFGILKSLGLKSWVYVILVVVFIDVFLGNLEFSRGLLEDVLVIEM